MAIATFAVPASPELLKDKASFENTDLFDSPVVFSDKAANAALLRDYEANRAAYKNSQLFPIAVCYLSFGDLKKSKEAFETFLSVKPDNLRAMRNLGNISLLMKDIDKAVEYYKKAIKGGDEKSVIFLGSAYIMSNKTAEIKDYLPILKKLSKTNLEALNVVMIYALRDKKNLDEKLAKEVLDNIDVAKVLESATFEGMSTILRIYVASSKLWGTTAMIIPARAAAIVEAWPLANSTYKKILAEQPNNPIALRGMSVVSYRTGDVLGAANQIMKAYECGDKDAALDGLNLFLLSKNRSIWGMFEKLVDDAKLNPQIRAGLIQISVQQDDCVDMFYRAALNGQNTELLYSDEGVSKLIEEGLKKYSSDKRAAEVSKKLKELKK